MPEQRQLAQKLGIDFKNERLLMQALVHRSYLNEHSDFPVGHNERLEFLGDAVLELIVTEYLFLSYPEKTEGELTDWRASLVNAKTLSQIAKEIELDKYLFLSKGEAKETASKGRQYILADAMEALIGAIYLDQGSEVAKRVISELVLSKLENIIANKLYLDPKSYFQEKAQEVYGFTPRYEVLSSSGPDHEKTFEVGLYLDDKIVSTGRGMSKQEAQVDAAENGLKKEGWR
ncbi:MAG TPA: ribonuclease III [bacterium]|nr:ribonuclease III [bacterium]